MTDRPGAAAGGLFVAVGVLASVVLSGCGPQEGPEADSPTDVVPFSSGPIEPGPIEPGPIEPLPGDPTEPGQTFPVPPPPPPVSWAGDGDRLVVVTYGSSSCPMGPTDVDVVGDQELRLEIEPLFPDRDPCTADMAPSATEIDLPRGVSADESVTVHLRYAHGAEETVVLPPAGR